MSETSSRSRKANQRRQRRQRRQIKQMNRALRVTRCCDTSERQDGPHNRADCSPCCPSRQQSRRLACSTSYSYHAALLGYIIFSKADRECVAFDQALFQHDPVVAYPDGESEQLATRSKKLSRSASIVAMSTNKEGSSCTAWTGSDVQATGPQRSLKRRTQLPWLCS